MPYLNECHRLMLVEDSGINPEVIAERGYRSVGRNDRDHLLTLGFSRYQLECGEGLLIPLWAPHGEIVSYQLRPDQPREHKGKIVKYESLPKVPPVLDTPPRVRRWLTDPSVPLWVTEGSKKADSAASRGIACLSLSGVWAWRGTSADGGNAVIADLESVAVRGRKVVIVFDSDVMTKDAVQLALLRFGGYLERRGANVRYANLARFSDGS